MHMRKWKKRLVLITGIIMFTLLLAAGGYTGVILFGNYTIDEKDLVMSELTTLVDSDGDTVAHLFEENRELVTIEDVPDYVQGAFISVEDHRFHQHTGFDLRAIGRALYRDITSGSLQEGGSTITQQLAKNIFLTPEKSFLRKTEEVLIAINLERRYTKDEILEMYLNQIYFGHGAHGIQAASKLYFDKEVSELTIEEGALLAALPKGPNLYSPFVDHDRSLERRNLVLGLMNRHGYIESDEAVRLQGRTLPEEQSAISANPAYSVYVDMVLEEAERRFGIREEEILRGGYTIETAIDQTLQESLYEQFQDAAQFPENSGEQIAQGSAVFLDNETAGVRAVSGGRDYVRKGLNRAVMPRQPGSAIKPVAVFAPALEEGVFEPYSLLADQPIDFDGYQPRNISGSYQGEVTLYDAIVDSVNVPAVFALDELGIDPAKRYLEEQDVYVDDNGLSIALGGLEEGLSPLQMASLYRTLADDGWYKQPYLIERIVTSSGIDILPGDSLEARQVYSSQTAWYMTRMLEAAVDEGTGRHGEFDGSLAGKTGTSSGRRDLWFAGFTPELSGAYWMGFDRYDEETVMNDSSARSVMAMKTVLSDAGHGEIELAFTKPEGVSDLEEPVRMIAVNDLEADTNFSFTGANIHLSWSASDDERLTYRLYELKGNGDRELVEELKGADEYTIRGVNLFSTRTYQVVPYNPQVGREGEPSNTVEAGFSFFSRQ
ncbi:transglycosylase domain-containing protein [Salisediminibacterium selenitireducens]|uniref:Penicillin-binding protein, 1A family n=1 Tax=Bacillus selenitireducens (strain ATCC 700615 / DSM 15326 / MLS10) TaxID=439292 RepID=D6XX05_BACIE|nr:PBP1A family penicillin-binding protein [Salisediminibacterium selenitireducens]ADH99981.1 penicillin-binding protein, 1A family [[Bacillus] selenitireducens MLS10]